LSNKNQAGFQLVGLLVNVSFWSAVELTLNQQVRTSNSLGARSTLILHGMGLTLPQLCQNYMLLCVRIGKIDRLKAALRA
jgi:hypothetical protein